MKGRILATVTSFDDADKILMELGSIQAKIAEEEARLNRIEQEARQEFKQRTEAIYARKEELERILEEFCVRNKYEFEKIRTRELVHGIIGFRTNPPKVALLNRKYNVNTVIELLKKLKMSRFIRVKEDIDKESIISEYLAKEIDDVKLASVGLKIDQAETFICEPKWEELQ